MRDDLGPGSVDRAVPVNVTTDTRLLFKRLCPTISDGFIDALATDKKAFDKFFYSQFKVE